MILVVDDLRTFHFDATYARTSAHAIQILSSITSLDQLWLDHDLGPLSANPNTFDSTMPVVAFLEERAFYGNAIPINQVFIHSANPAAVPPMMQALRPIYSVRQVDALGYLNREVPDSPLHSGTSMLQ